MLELSRIVAGRDKPCKMIEKIKSFELISENNQKYFFKDTCLYTDLNGAISTADIHDICLADYSKARGKIGHVYRIENQYIQGGLS